MALATKTAAAEPARTAGKNPASFRTRIWKDLRKNYSAYLIILPAVLFYLLF